jgi:hypothetical protein
MTQVTGRVFISLNGQRIRSKEKAALEFGGVERTPEVSDSGVDGYSEKVVPPKVDCKINHTADTSVKDLADFKDGTLVFETDTGRPYTITGAFCSKPPKLEGGELTLEFMGVECLEG